MKAPLRPTNFVQKLLLIFLVFISPFIVAQIKSFPTALGGAAYSRGDVQYTLHEVTNLNPDGPGSLWNAMGDNRIVVFRVSGIINMGDVGGSRTLNNCIILGQTAPQGGITVVGRGWRWQNCNNVIIRHVRFRTWQCQEDVWDPCSADAIDVISSNNIIFDHCSFAYGGDETLSFRGDNTHSLTVQNSMFSYSKTGMLLGDSNLFNSYDMSVINNFWTEISHRFPNPNGNGRIDVIGNVVYNWLNRLFQTGGSIQLNEIGNAYTSPYNNGQGHKPNFNTGSPLIYTQNNRWNNVLTADGQDNSILYQSWQGGRDPEPSDFTNTMFPLLNFDIPLPNGDDALLKVQNREMGANAYLDNNGSPVFEIDDLDQEAYDDYDNGIYYDWSTALNWEDLPQRQWLIDNLPNYGVIENEHSQTTHNGVVPNVWITNQGLDPSTFNPLGNDLDPIYTNIEIYSFGVDNAEVVIAEGVEVSPESATINIPDTIDLEVIFTPSNTTNKSGVWTSSDEGIATVDSEGIVAPVSAGVVTITFTSNDGGFTDSSTIIVTNETIGVTGVEVNPDTMTLDIGQTQQATATFTPQNATNQNGTWSSNDENIATVNQEGEVTGVSEGTTTVIFTSEDGEFTDIIEIIVADVFFGTYEFYNADTDELIQLITEDTTFDLNEIGNQINFRSIPQGGDNNPEVESILVEWNGPENGSWLQSIPIYTGMAGHDQDIFDLYPYAVSEGTYNFTITYFSADDAQGNVIAIDNFSLTFFLDNGILANAGNDVSICTGESVTLTASGGTNFLWSTGEQSASIIVSPTITTTYTVTVSNDLGESDIDEVTVIVNEIPNLEVSDDTTILSGESTVLTVQGAESFLWSNGETSSSITVTPNQTTTYTVTGFNGSCESQAQVTITVENELFVSAGEDQRICQDAGAFVELTATEGDSYLWNTGETTQSILVNPMSTTTYSVTVTLGSQQASADVTVFVDPNPNVVIVNGDTVDILDGDFITLSATGANSYEWSNGATQPNIAVSPSSTTTYEVRGYINDCYDEKQITVNVFPEVVANAGEDRELCLGESVVLTATGGDEYLWSNGETTASIEVSPEITTDYTVTVFNAMDFDEDTVRVEVSPCDIVSDNPQDITTEFSFDIFPNPARDIVNVRINGGATSTDIQIFDVMGKMVMTNTVENNALSPSLTKEVNVSNLLPGIYFVRMADGVNEIVKKLVIRS